MSDIPDNLEHFASMVSNRGNSQYLGVNKVISVRLPIHVFIKIEALTKFSGQTRNKLLVAALDGAMEYAISELSAEDSKKFDSVIASVEVDLADTESGEV